MTLTHVETAEAATNPTEKSIEGKSPLRLSFERIRHDKVALFSLGVIVFMVLVAIFAFAFAAITGHDPIVDNELTGTSDTGQPLSPGSNGYILGTDQLGRDILVRLAYGAQISLTVGVLATLLATAVGVIVGLLAGYYGGWLDGVLGRIMDIVLAFPYILFAVVLVEKFGASEILTILVIAFFSWAAIGRIVRGQAISQREKEYVEAAHSMGASDLRIMFVDILPNLVAPVIVLGTLLIPVAIVFESTLSFLGLGITAPTPSWGNMLSDAQGVGYQAWWFWLFPMLFLLATTLAFNLLGDAVRDALDPRSERIFAARRKKKGGAPAATPAEAAPA